MEQNNQDFTDLLTSIKSVVEGMALKHDSLTQNLVRIENSLTQIQSELNKTTKSTYDNAKDIQFLQEVLRRNEGEMKDQIEIVWDSGIRKLGAEIKEHKEKCETTIKEYHQSEEEAHRKVKEDVMKDWKIWFFGLGFFLLVNIILTIAVIYFK
jgi:hypothetical protein